MNIYKTQAEFVYNRPRNLTVISTNSKHHILTQFIQFKMELTIRALLLRLDNHSIASLIYEMKPMQLNFQLACLILMTLSWMGN